jgi:hypothetical protein
MPSTTSDFQCARSDDVGLSNEAKSVTSYLPFHEPRTAAPSGTSSPTVLRGQYAAGDDDVDPVLEIGFERDQARPDASSVPDNDNGCVVIGP